MCLSLVVNCNGSGSRTPEAPWMISRIVARGERARMLAQASTPKVTICYQRLNLSLSIYIYIHIYIYTYLSLYIYIYIYTHTYILTYIHIITSNYIITYIQLYTSLSLYIYIYLYRSLSLSLYIYIHTYSYSEDDYDRLTLYSFCFGELRSRCGAGNNNT